MVALTNSNSGSRLSLTEKNAAGSPVFVNAIVYLTVSPGFKTPVGSLTFTTFSFGDCSFGALAGG